MATRPQWPGLAVCLFLSGTYSVTAEDSAFVYQGHLTLSGVPVTGIYDFEFSLHDDPSSGSQIGAAVSAGDLTVKEGLFQTALDFGTAAFDGSPRWLEIAVRDGASTGSFNTLAPRTPLGRTPYAIHALKAEEADTAGFASDAAALGGQPASAFAPSGHTHTGATIVDGTIDAADLASNPASLAKVTGGAAIISGDGNVGIGTVSPTEKLHVEGNMAAAGGLSLGNPVQGGISYDSGNGLLRIGVNGTGIDQQLPVITDLITGSQIPGPYWQTFTAGVSGYLTQIDVERGHHGASASAVAIALHKGNGLQGEILTQGTLPSLQPGYYWQTFTVTPPVWLTAGQTYSIVLSGSNIFWNIASYDAYPGGALYPGEFAPFDAGFRTYMTAPQPHLTIAAQTGNVTIPSDLTVYGKAYKPGGGPWESTSDSRAKTNIATIAGALDKILRLRGVTYQWKNPAAVGAKDNSPLMGMVADEVEQVFPQWVHLGPDGLRRLEIIGFEGLVVEAFKEYYSLQNQERQKLRDEILALKKENEDLRARLGRLEQRLKDR